MTNQQAASAMAAQIIVGVEPGDHAVARYRAKFAGRIVAQFGGDWFVNNGMESRPATAERLVCIDAAAMELEPMLWGAE